MSIDTVFMCGGCVSICGSDEWDEEVFDGVEELLYPLIVRLRPDLFQIAKNRRVFEVLTFWTSSARLGVEVPDIWTVVWNRICAMQ